MRFGTILRAATLHVRATVALFTISSSSYRALDNSNGCIFFVFQYC